MKLIHLFINDETLYTVNVDEETYQALTIDPERNLVNYVNQLQALGQIEDADIRRITYSVDNETFSQVNIDNIEQDEESAKETESESDKSACEWSEAHTKYLLDKYGQYLPQVGPMKRFKRKKDLWKAISLDIFQLFNIERTPLQCENRYKTVLKRKKKAVEINTKSGNSRVDVPYEEELNKINAVDDSIEPEVCLGTKKCVVKVLEEPKPKKVKTEKTLSVQDTLEKLHREKEEGKERRHQEKMALMRDFLKSFFQTCADKTDK